MYNENIVMVKGLAQKDRRLLLKILVVLVTFILPGILLTYGVFLTYENIIFKTKVEVRKLEVEERLIPSKVLNNKSKYSQQRIMIRGKVLMESVVCSRKQCPEGDSCCGCPEESNLLIADADVVLFQKTGGRLRIIGHEGQPFCQRKKASCDYDCGDWIDGATYDIWGTFFSQAPPPGWKLSLEYYFQVEGKEFVTRIALGEKIQTIFKEIKERISALTTSGQYILR